MVDLKPLLYSDYQQIKIRRYHQYKVCTESIFEFIKLATSHFGEAVTWKTQMLNCVSEALPRSH